MKAVEQNPAEFFDSGGGGDGVGGKNKKSHRTRKRVERPKQTYLYAAQRRALELEKLKSIPQASGGGMANGIGNANNFDSLLAENGQDSLDANESLKQQQQLLLQQQHQQKQMELARSLGIINPAAQMADAIIGDGAEEVPRIVASIRVDGTSSGSSVSGSVESGENRESITSNSFAYIVYKPSGWAILGGERKNKKEKLTANTDTDSEDAGSSNNDIAFSDNKPKYGKYKRVKAYDEENDDFTYVEYNEADVLAVLTPEERAELLREGGLNLVDDLADHARGALARLGKNGMHDDDDDDGYYSERGYDASAKTKIMKKNPNGDVAVSSSESTTSTTNDVAPRVKATMESTFTNRPSLVSWLKDVKSREGTPIKGGKNWVALAGATEVDDTGLVLLCPRDRMGAVHVDRVTYVAVVGNG